MSICGVLFDLDGTLVDSLGDLTDAVNHMLCNFSTPELTTEAVRKLVGKGARHLVQQALSSDQPADIDQGLKLFLDFNADHIADKSRLYPGVRETLDKLAVSGIRMAIVSNKNEAMSRLILQALDAERYFSVISGGDSCVEMKPSPMPLLKAMEQLGTTPGTTVMVGDSINDIQAGRQAGITTIGCSWGIGFPEELVDAHQIVASCPELEQLLMQRGA
jgi:phosphoglycolate phosphatase